MVIIVLCIEHRNILIVYTIVTYTNDSDYK
jgi:hypothetical protein